MAKFCTKQALDNLIDAITDAVLERIEHGQQAGKCFDPLLNREQTMEMLNISSTTLWKWERAGIIYPTMKARYRRSEVIRVREEHVKGQPLDE